MAVHHLTGTTAAKSPGKVPVAQKPKMQENVMKKKRKVIQGLRFLDLPPELRNRVYKYACFDGRVEFLRGRCEQIGCIRPFIKLICASKQIHQEAVGLFYGNAKFTFRSITGAGRWLRRIGSMIKHIRYVKLDARCIKSIASQLRIMREAPSLRVIELSREFLFGFTYSEIAGALTPLMADRMKAKKSKEQRLKVLDVVRVDQRYMAFYEYSPEELEERSWSDERAVKIRAELRKRLGFEES